MYSNTISLQFGFDPNDFKAIEGEPIKSDKGFVYFLEQDNKKIPCPYCKSNDIKVKERYLRTVNCSISDVIENKLIIKCIRFKCDTCKKTFVKPLNGVCKYGKIANFTKQMITTQFSSMDTFERIAENHKVSVATVMNIIDDDIADPIRLPLPEVLCIDEFYLTDDVDSKYCVLLVDWATSNVIDIIKNRRIDYLRDYFNKISKDELKKVKYFVSDLYSGYQTIREEFMPNSVPIADFFHVVLQLNRVTNVIRTKVMKDIADSHPDESRFMKSHWKLFLTKATNINKTKTFTLASKEEIDYQTMILRCNNLSSDLFSAYDTLDDVYKLKKDQSFTDAKESIEFIINKLNGSLNDQLKKVGQTYQKWLVPIANAYTYHINYINISNAMAEGTNKKIKNVINNAYGYQNFTRFRKRTLLILRNVSDKTKNKRRKRMR